MNLVRVVLIQIFRRKNLIEQTPTEKLGYYVAKPIYRQFQNSIKKVSKGNQDRVYVVDGREGVGKTTVAFQFAYIVDPNFSLDNVVFTAEQFEDKIRKLDKFRALVFDESFNGLSSKGALSKQNKKLVRLLMECRQRSLYVFVVLPSIFLLEKYVAVFRSQCLFHSFASKKNNDRRYYKVYNYHNKKLLYLLGKHLMDYTKPKVPKSYRFYAKFPPTIDKVAYEKKKHEAFLSNDEDITEESKHIHQRNLAWYILHKKYGLTQVELVKLNERYGLGIQRSTMSESLARFAKKFGIRDSSI